MSVPNVTAHRLIAAMCVELANEVYEELAMRNNLHKMMKKRKEFIAHCAPTLKPQAKQALAAMLAEPDDVVSPAQKEAIHEALCLDNAMPRGGTSYVTKKDAWAGKH